MKPASVPVAQRQPKQHGTAIETASWTGLFATAFVSAALLMAMPPERSGRRGRRGGGVILWRSSRDIRDRAHRGLA